MTPHFHTLQIKDIRRETEDAVSISFEIPANLVENYQYLPGQYLTLKANINGEEVRRSYSLCSSPLENEWRVAIKKIDNGLFSTFANEQLVIGDQMDVMTPMGKFLVETKKDQKKRYVLFAAGSGITPILSIAKTVLNTEPNSEVILFYGNKNFQSILFREEIENMKNIHMDNFQVIHLLSRESLGNPLQKGRLDADKVAAFDKAFLTGLDIDDVYVCGPEDMIHAVKDHFMAKGMDEKHVHFELFGTASAPKHIEVTAEDDVHAKVKVIIDGDELDINLDTSGINILDAAQAAGADLPYACKGGVCCTCKAKVLQGEVRMDVNYALEKDEVEAGYILTCQSHPTSANVVVSFDE
ncbi:MAG: phenylacetate-CoA oxygenase/reductase subunit PaaK [Crocinitomicaceae bacterium]|jgi:ring-1,2-phenylacetyl-CoA epoxidase subunit PaaE|nr:phenylacetate-CoA oxygenase/reductase subunit PaaK [Crocinitomicaceae bacterium]